MLERAVAAVTRALFVAACAALLVLLGAYVAEVVLRYAFNAPTRWASDVVSYALLVCVSLALPAVTRDGGHVAITSVIERFPLATRQALQRALAWVSSAVCAAAVLLLAGQAWGQWQSNVETVAAFAIPKWWLSGLAAVGMAGAALQFALQAMAVRPSALGAEREL